MRVFVAGGTGVIGSRLLPLLARAGHEVIVLNRSALARGFTEKDLCDPYPWTNTQNRGVPQEARRLADRTPTASRLGWSL